MTMRLQSAGRGEAVQCATERHPLGRLMWQLLKSIRVQPFTQRKHPPMSVRAVITAQ